MSRLLLLGLTNTEVDLLTRVRDLSSESEVVVVHPDPESLVLRLARLAGYVATAEVPDPAPRDVVVASGAVGAGGDLAAPWRDAGMPVLAPSEFTRERWESARRQALDGPRDVRPAKAEASESREAEAAQATARLSPPPPIRFVGSEDRTEEPPRPSPPPHRPLEPVEPSRPAAAAPADGAGTATQGDPGWEAFASPEATFAYLAQRALGGEGDAVLWWDGAIGAWSPWCVAGNPELGTPERGPAEGHDLETRWGRFRLVADHAEDASRWNPHALRRVAEDLALRDLMDWREELRQLEGFSLAGPGATPEEADHWFRPFAEILRPSAMFLWRGETDGWSLVGARGAGITYAGRLVMPGSLLAATFDAPELWRRWDPAPGLRAYCQFEDQDRRWPLRLARVRDVLKGRGPSR